MLSREIAIGRTSSRLRSFRLSGVLTDMQRRTFNQLLASAITSQVPSKSALQAFANRPQGGSSEPKRCYEQITPGIHLDYHFPEWDPLLLSKADGRLMTQTMANTGAQMVV